MQAGGGKLEDDRYAVVSIIGHWRRVVDDLEKAGLHPLCPVEKRNVKSPHRKHRRLVPKEMPVFAGYMFLLWHDDIDWRALLSIKGVNEILVNNGKPSLTTKTEILKAKSSRMYLSKSELKDGDRVRITEGTYAGFAGMLRGEWVDVEYFGRQTPFKVSMAMIEKDRTE